MNVQPRQQYTICYLLSGSGRVECSGLSYTLSPGDLLQRGPGVPMILERDSLSEWRECFVTLPKRIYEAYLDLHFFPEEPWLPLCLPCDRFPRLLEHLRIDESIVHDHPIDVLHKVIALLRAFWLGVDQRQRSPDEQVILELCERVKTDVQLMSTAEDMAKAAGLGYEKFRKLFVKVVGMTPKHYLRRCQLEFAKERLVYGLESMEDLSELMGYADVSSFYIQFKKQTGWTPSQYRKHMRL